MKNTLIEELKFCIDLYEKQGYCNFGGTTHCNKCATPYLLYKLIYNKILHDENMKRLTLDDWKRLITTIEN